MLKLADKVQIKPLGAAWHHGASESLSGLIGSITKAVIYNHYGFENERPYLVEFSSYPKPWSPSRPSKAWWFAENELELII